MTRNIYKPYETPSLLLKLKEVKKFYQKERMKKCIYCQKEVPEESVIDFCKTCGCQHFGKKMFNAIIENMEEARDKGDLNQGSISL